MGQGLPGNRGDRPMTEDPGDHSDTKSPVSTPAARSVPDRALVHSWVLVSDFRPYVAAIRQKYGKIPEHADAGIGYVYVDHHAGISMKVERLCMQDDQQLGGDAAFALDDLVSLRFRYSSFKALNMKKLSEDVADRLNLPATPEWLALYNPQDLQAIRELEWLDPFRASGFFDDVMATLPGIGGDVPELIWIRLVRYVGDPDRFHGILLNEPFRDYGVHRNDTIEVRVARNPEGISLVAVPCKVSREKDADSTISGDLPGSGGGA